LFLVGSLVGGGGSLRLRLATFFNRYYCGIFDVNNTPETAQIINQIPADGDLLKITMDKQPDTGNNYFDWDVGFYVNDVLITTPDTIQIPKTNNVNDLVHCNLRHGVEVRYQPPVFADPQDYQFDNYNLTMT
jgi:hypothetical protein